MLTPFISFVCLMISVISFVTGMWLIGQLSGGHIANTTRNRIWLAVLAVVCGLTLVPGIPWIVGFPS